MMVVAIVVAVAAAAATWHISNSNKQIKTKISRHNSALFRMGSWNSDGNIRPRNQQFRTKGCLNSHLNASCPYRNRRNQYRLDRRLGCFDTIWPLSAFEGCAVISIAYTQSQCSHHVAMLCHSIGIRMQHAVHSALTKCISKSRWAKIICDKKCHQQMCHFAILHTHSNR